MTHVELTPEPIRTVSAQDLGYPSEPPAPPKALVWLRPDPCAMCAGPVLVVEPAEPDDERPTVGMCQCGDGQRYIPVAYLINAFSGWLGLNE